MSQKTINSSSLILCSLCNKHTNILTDPESGEIVCTNCGSIINDKYKRYNLFGIYLMQKIEVPNLEVVHQHP